MLGVWLMPPAARASELGVIDKRLSTLFAFSRTRRVLLVVNTPDGRVFVARIKCEGSLRFVTLIRGLRLLLDSICTRVSMWMRLLGFSRANSSGQKQMRLLYRWHVAAKALKTQCWTNCGRFKSDYSRCSSLCRRMSGRKTMEVL